MKTKTSRTDQISRKLSVYLCTAFVGGAAASFALQADSYLHLNGGLTIGIFLVLWLLFAALLDSCFWSVAKERFAMFVYEYEADGERLIYVRHQHENHFVQYGQELVIRSSQEPGQGVEILSGPRSVPPDDTKYPQGIQQDK